MPNRRLPEANSQPEDSRRRLVKRQKKPNGASHESRIPSVAPLKSKIHDLKRALQHNERMPADVRIEKERALAGYKQDLENAGREKQKQLMIKRYHMVRFVERQKAERHVKRAQRAVDASSPDGPDHLKLQEDLDAAKVDVCYAMYYPLTEKYVSLYPRKDENDHSKGYKTSIEKKPEMWEIVRQSMDEGTLDSLREGRSAALLKTGMEKLPASRKALMPKHNGKTKSSGSKTIQAEEMDGESDGGFFEEDNHDDGVSTS